MGKRKQVEPVAAKPVTSDGWWQRMEALKLRLVEAQAERTALTEMLGSLTLQAAGEDGAAAEVELGHVRTRLAELANVEQECEAAIRIAERRWRAAGDAASRAHRETSRARAYEMGGERERFAAHIDGQLEHLNELLAGFVAAGRLEIAALRAAGIDMEAGGISDPVDAVSLREAIYRVAPTLARMAGITASSFGVESSQLRPLAVSEARRQATIGRALARSAVRDELEAEQPAVVEIAA